MKYIQLKSNGNLHLKVEGKARTVCGRTYSRSDDYLPVSEDEYEAQKGYYSVCYKCLNKPKGPRTIKAAFTPERFLG